MSSEGQGSTGSLFSPSQQGPLSPSQKTQLKNLHTEAPKLTEGTWTSAHALPRVATLP